MRNRRLPGTLVLVLIIQLASCRFGSAENHPDPSTETSGNESGEGKNTRIQDQSSETSLKEFPQNLGRNLASILDKPNFKPLFVGAALTGIALSIDDPIHDHFKDRNHSTLFADSGATMGDTGIIVPSVFGLLIAGQIARNDRFHSYTYALAQGFTISNGLTAALKAATRRERPDGANLAFPSGHASNFFMIAAVTQHYYGRTAGIVGYAVASGVAVSRLAKDVHWASDIAAGATLGYIVGSSVSGRTGMARRMQRITLIPNIDRKKKSVSVALFIK
jgi:membrane-associated phospholipid phosphatase